MDTYSILYVSLTGEPLLDIYGTGDIGLWTNKGTLYDPFVEFIYSRLKKLWVQDLCGKTTLKSKD